MDDEDWNSSRKTPKKSRRRRSRSHGELEPPTVTYAALIAAAIQKAPNQQLLLDDIYRYVDRNRYRVPVPSHPNWKNSVRHNLSLRPCFIKVPRFSKKGKSLCAWWKLDEGKIPKAAKKAYEFLMTKVDLIVIPQRHTSHHHQDSDYESDSGDVGVSAELTEVEEEKSDDNNPRNPNVNDKTAIVGRNQQQSSPDRGFDSLSGSMETEDTYLGLHHNNDDDEEDLATILAADRHNQQQHLRMQQPQHHSFLFPTSEWLTSDLASVMSVSMNNASFDTNDNRFGIPPHSLASSMSASYRISDDSASFDAPKRRQRSRSDSAMHSFNPQHHLADMSRLFLEDQMLSPVQEQAFSLDPIATTTTSASQNLATSGLQQPTSFAGVTNLGGTDYGLSLPFLTDRSGLLL